VGALGLLIPLVTSTAAASTATGDTSPVNLSTKVDTAAGKAAQRATVVAGDARFEVLAPDVVRMEYSPTGSFLDQPTFTVLDRDFVVPKYTKTVADGWLTLRTSSLVLRYKLGSGPFGPTNTDVKLLRPVAGMPSDVTPTWSGECTFGQSCQSGAATLSGGAALAEDHTGYQSPAGFVADYQATGASASWQVLGAPAGAATVSIRYANNVGSLGGPAPRTLSLVVNGTATRLTLQPTASWNDWSTVTEPVTLTAGTNTVALTCASGDDCNVNVDDIAVTSTGGTAAPFLPADPLGGYIRSFDSTQGSYTNSGTCTGDETGATCAADIPNMAPGLLDKAGWYVLDDTSSDVWSSSGWLAPRPAGDVEDGYLFGYGQDYTGALTDLAKLTGPAPLLPEYLFGNWLSRYYPYTTADYENQILPEFQQNGVSLDTLSVDTDWKSPNQWDGWEWNPTLFPDPKAFLAWAKANDIHVTLNVHSSVGLNDPEYAEAQDIAGGTLATGPCNAGQCGVWDWSQVAQAESNFALQQPLYDDGVAFTWLDWCCDNSNVSMPGVTPDSWINHLYAQQMVNTGQRGFVLSRIGASLQDSQAGAYPTLAWADHRSAVAFTGDTWSTWNTLAMEAQLAQDESSIGEPYVSDDIGGFLGAPGGGPNDPDDLYLRWLQLGTFQPIMREHSNSGQNARLPWEYDSATQAVGDQFLRLREELVPYLYTLADQASTTGLPMTRGLYLAYPNTPQAYDYPSEYLLGSDMLVAPVTTPGQVATTKVWFPPGRWTDWFTGATFQGPATETLDVPTSRMPVFVKAGGIVPLQSATGHAQTAGSAALTLRVFAGGSGTYSMYDDAGQGLGYQQGQHTETPISYTDHGAAGSTVVIGAARGTYQGAPTHRGYTLDLVDTSKPRGVLVDGHAVPASGWTYDSATHTLAVSLGSLPTSQSTTIIVLGGTPMTVPEPAATQLSIDPASSVVTTSGGTTTVKATFTNSGPTAVDDAAITLSSPDGWQATPTTPLTASTIAAGDSLTASWSVTAPSSSAGQAQTGDFTASATYKDAATGQTGHLTAAETAEPVITSVSPSTAVAGDTVTVTGVDFGASQGSGYLTFSDSGTNWGAPPDAATFKLDSWSDTSITFTVPSPSGSNGEWHVVPGSTATITVTNDQGATSTPANLTIGSS
jgi:alpha-glucosidase (family GH31 glycosyl hydrolase)